MISGDEVNTASRLHELAKTHRTALVLSDDLIAREEPARAWADRAGLRSLVNQAMRGRTPTETIWIGEPPAPQDADADAATALSDRRKRTRQGDGSG